MRSDSPWAYNVILTEKAMSLARSCGRSIRPIYLIIADILYEANVKYNTIDPLFCPFFYNPIPFFIDVVL
jgi:hypothetical protein